MNASMSQGSPPRVLPKITRADMGIDLPRLDDKCLDEEGNTDPVKKRALEALIARYEWVYDLGGVINATKQVKGKGDEPGIRFVGQFKAHVMPQIPKVGNQWFVSARAHVPRFYEEVLYAAVLEAKKNDPDATLQFLVRFGVKPSKPDKPSAVGYEWTAQPLVDLDTVEDPVQALFDRAQGAPQLTGPTTGSSPESASPGHRRGHARQAEA